MKILLIFTLCLISDGGSSKEVTGYSGGGVFIKCKYDREYTYNQKYFCKGSMPGCSDQIKTGDKNKWVNLGRFSLFDTKSSEFWVMIRELTVQDNGTYQCGVDKSLIRDIYTPVELKVKEGSLVSREVTAYTGGRINIKCRYEDEYKDKSKSFCKIGTPQWCFNQKQTKPNSEWSHDGRLSIHDNRSAGFFSVFITELNLEDTGTYACGVVVSDKLEIYTAVKLNVKEDLSYEKSISKTVHVGGDLTVRYKNNSWTSPASLPAGFPASTVIIVSVILLLLLIGTIAIFVALQKRQKLQADSASTTFGHDPGNQVVPLDICEYEEIKDSRRLSASDAGISTIYSTAELPTIPSDHHMVYANSKLPTSPYDSVVYPTAQLPTICSDQDIYSTAQLTTRLSAAESDEGLNYTSVSFHAKSTSSNDAAAKIIFKKTELVCDYDSLSHVTSSG
ncbi:uncharacterized protein LOC113640763 isoform X4 [Tachysurus ichikawai]